MDRKDAKTFILKCAVECSACKEIKVWTCRALTSVVTKAMKQSAAASRCWLCGEN